MKSQARVPRIIEYKNRSIVECLEMLLDQAKNGEIIGFMYGVKHAPFKHSIGVVGSYEEMPFCGKRVADKISQVLERRSEALETWD